MAPAVRTDWIEAKRTVRLSARATGATSLEIGAGVVIARGASGDAR
jgi:hypothetical protein